MTDQTDSPNDMAQALIEHNGLDQAKGIATVNAGRPGDRKAFWTDVLHLLNLETQDDETPAERDLRIVREDDQRRGR